MFDPHGDVVAHRLASIRDLESFHLDVVMAYIIMACIRDLESFHLEINGRIAQYK